MSTRSAKRIHNSFHESLLQSDVELVAENERKTRSSSRRLKENVEEVNVRVKSKKRVNYVSYPTDDRVGVEMVNRKEDEVKPTRFLRKNALEEQNLVTFSTENTAPLPDKKTVRTNRRLCKFAEDNLEHIIETQNHFEEEVPAEESRKSKKGKKMNRFHSEQAANEVVVYKKKNKVKKLKQGSRSDFMIVEDIDPEKGQINCLNKSNMSVDSFHSAAGRLEDVKDDVPCDMEKSLQKDSGVDLEAVEIKDGDVKPTEKPEGRKTRSAARLSGVNISSKTPNKVVKETRKRKSSAKLECLEHGNSDKETESEPLDTFNRVSKKCKSIIKNSVTKERVADTTFDTVILNTTSDVEDLEERKSINATFDKSNTAYDKNYLSETRKSAVVELYSEENSCYYEKNNSYNNETEIYASPSSSLSTKRQSKSSINTTFEIPINSFQFESVNVSMIPEKSVLNITYEKDSKTDAKQENKARNSSIKNPTFDKDDLQSEVQSEIHNIDNLRKCMLSISSDKVSNEISDNFNKMEKFDSTFNEDKKLNETFDKSSKSSLITLDNSNITLDKSDVSRISITSDDSKSNIVNITPVFVESSMEESLVMSKFSPKIQAPLTPLKREGTFTKDGQEFECSGPTPLKTPTKRKSLPSPGCTPFHTHTSTSKEKSVLNVTRSIEKSRRSSLAEPLPRTTKVMFCSPVNNLAVVLQQSRKVIKSNLKGSNKSFVFEESGKLETGTAPRKRSYTQSDEDDARAKRKRLMDGLQHSVDRLSRPRTTSASAKVPDRDTPKRLTMPSKVSRTKLPNFAALHQKEFDKMESLDQCRERKAKRARQLLTPTGGVTVLERSSPRDNASEPQKSPNEPSKNLPKEQKSEKQPKEQKTEKLPKEQAKKPETPVKSLPTFKSLNPGYTRFGFKLNSDMNPFSVPSKSDSKNKNGVFKFASRKDENNTKPLKQIKVNFGNAILPARAGSTSVRREVAKQAVMREKSFTDKRNVKRNENRTVIKGVRTNRRFELQMMMRNLD